MGTYITPEDVWKQLGKDAFTKLTGEAVGTGDGSTSTWQLDHMNVISGSDTIYTDGTAVSSYNIDLDKGEITGLTAASGSAITADYWYGDIEDSQIQSIINQAEGLMEEMTGRTLATASTTEYLDVEYGQTEFFVRNYPVITFSAVSANTASSLGDSPAWSGSTQGLGNDFISNANDLKIGRFEYIDNKPPAGRDRLAVTYTYGYTTSDAGFKIAQELSTLLALRQMVHSAVYKAIFKGQDNFSPVRLDEIENRIKELKNILKAQSIEPI